MSVRRSEFKAIEKKRWETKEMETRTFPLIFFGQECWKKYGVVGFLSTRRAERAKD